MKTRILIGEELDDYMAPIANRPLPTPNVDSGQPPPWAANESECQNSNHALELPTQDEAAVAERPRHYELFSLPPDIDRTPVPHGDRSWLAIVAGSVVALVVVSLIAGVFFPKERMALQAKLFPDASPPTVISAAVAEHETPIWFDGLQPTAEEHKLLTEAAEALAGGDITKALSIYEKLQGMEPSSLVYEQLVRALRGQQVRLQSVTGSHGF
ncbi:MAG: hypothetical protein GY811_15505 [Myxococcales bacterium]|nr:hypothetical protein [Myxococcales bacterium]